MDAQTLDASMAYGRSNEVTIQLGRGLGAKASRAATNATAIRAPRTKPKAAPSKRLSQESPVNLKSVATSLATSAPTIKTAHKITRKPRTLETVWELRVL